jgi:2-oxo-4-hydroxy-4-carboxy-5-ureidoimidazoline decarboxylase
VGTVWPVDLDTFNAATWREANAVLLSCCASQQFATTVEAGRPYPSLITLEGAVSVAFESLTWDDVLEALNGHPRIGARADGRSAGAGWPGKHSQSAGEQSGVTDSDRAALAVANAEYEARFGHVFLICASGLAGGQMLAELRVRLGNNPDTERIVATRELHKITVLRLRKALS